MHREVEFECSSYLDKEYDILMVNNKFYYILLLFN